MDTIQDLSHYLVNKLASTPSPQRLLVGIAGIPASGKSTFAHILTESVNRLLLDDHALHALHGEESESFAADPQESQEVTGKLASVAHGETGYSGDVDVDNNTHIHDQAILVGLDGWHLSRAQLDLMPDPQTAHARRGAHWTFDGPNYVSFIHQLRSQTTTATDPTITATNTIRITAPSFDHALKDPTYDAVAIGPHHRIVIIEGLYTFLNIYPWSEAACLLDERWFIEVDKAEARRRLISRHVITGITKDDEEAAQRADLNDLPNGEFVIANMLQPTRIIQSKNLSTSPLTRPSSLVRWTITHD